MAILTVQRPTTAGANITLAAAAGGGDSFANDGRTLFQVTNGSGGAITVTFDSPRTCDFGLAANAAHDLAISVPAGESRYIGPFVQGRFNDASTGRVQVTYSDVTTLTVAAISF